MRTLTDESDAIVQRLQVKLDDTRRLTREAGQAAVDRLEDALSGFIGDAEALNGAMHQIDTVVQDTARGFDAAGRELPMCLGQAAGRLETFRAALGDVREFSVLLALRRLSLPPELPTFAEGSAGAEVLARLRSHYTMQQERAIHDGLVETGQPVSMAPPPALAEESLDDILF